ncbi:hypothetical protein GCM10027290_20540 [Micromonospora sonneratiae]
MTRTAISPRLAMSTLRTLIPSGWLMTLWLVNGGLPEITEREFNGHVDQLDQSAVWDVALDSPV